MDFYAILDQVIALLRQRQRVTYRALQRQFDLDEDALNDLKDALLYAHPQVVDDEGRGLRWTGDTVSTPVQAPPSTPYAPALAHWIAHVGGNIGVSEMSSVRISCGLI